MVKVVSPDLMPVGFRCVSEGVAFDGREQIVSAFPMQRQQPGWRSDGVCEIAG